MASRAVMVPTVRTLPLATAGTATLRSTSNSRMTTTASAATSLSFGRPQLPAASPRGSANFHVACRAPTSAASPSRSSHSPTCNNGAIFTACGCCTPSTPSPLALAAPTLAQQTAGYKTKTALKLLCPSCFFTRRRGKLRVICKENKKHKQVQG
ncbi:hypothetical protein DFJ73DRAFT_809101 [Zopfochytrium polystomum]|nr:hypothetical protein DFJ73DRAFT_809101 [Zopfochytrium polystomum]